MNKIIKLFLLSIISLPLFAQKFEPEPPLFYEYYYSQTDSANGLFQFVFRINYNKLFFVKEGEKYEANISVTLEVKDSVENTIRRTDASKRVSVSKFDETLDHMKSVHGLLNINLTKKKYFATITLSDVQANKDITFERFPIDLVQSKPKYFIVYEKENQKYYLANRGNTIPFDSSTYSLVYEHGGKSVLGDSTKTDSLCLKFLSETDSLQFCSTKIFKTAFFLQEDSLGIYLSPIKNALGKNHLFKDISVKLPEGKFKFYENESQRTAVDIKWWNKPLSLLNYEVSLKALEIIEPKKTIDSLRSLGQKSGYRAFTNYWKKFDPTPNSCYNELMAEFYSRVDYTQKTFANFTTPDAILSDRGQIYIKYGAPVRIERTTTPTGKTLEIWFYKGKNNIYYFRDITGNGNYQLVKKR